ncbi:hypothetical protein BRD11_03000 [Halobacteriales archaeon SW_12_69_24]|nr:MAG: hypothetical protein BRD11_03000 [Halobacteriales archaeon SW_12_69_24]
MKSYPPVPRVDDAPATLLESGHLWLQEYVDGGQLRFQLRDTGALRFGDARRPFGEDVPRRYRHAVRHVRAHLDRAALRAAVDDVETVTFVGVSTHRRAVPYDLARIPSVLGVDIWDDDRAEFLPPDEVERVFDRLGLAAVNTFDREVRAADFDPTPDAVPASAWYNGPAAGVVLRNKTGDVATLINPAVSREPSFEPLEGDGDAVVDRLVTDAVMRRVVDGLPADREPTAEALFDRVEEELWRAHHGRLAHHETEVDPGAVAAAVGRRVGEWLARQR